MPIFRSTISAIRTGLVTLLSILGFLIVNITMLQCSRCLAVQSFQPAFQPSSRWGRRLLEATEGTFARSDGIVVSYRTRSRITYRKIRPGCVVEDTATTIRRISKTPLSASYCHQAKVPPRPPTSRLYYSTSDNPMDGEGDAESGDSLSSAASSSIVIPELSNSEYNVDLESDGLSYGDWNPKSPVSTSATPIYLQGLNPSQIEAVSQPLQDTITRVIAGPGSGKTKVLTCRIAHLLRVDAYSKVLAVTFTRKAAGEMKERLERLLREQEEQLRQSGEEVDDTIRFDRHGDIVQEFAVDTSGDKNGHGSATPPPKGLERVELGTFHSVCAKIMRYNGDLLQHLPSVGRDMSQASFVLVPDPSSTNIGDDDDDDDERQKSGTASTRMVPAEINLNGQFAIVDQPEQLRILKGCLDEKEIDLKALDIKPVQILAAISTMKETFSQNQDPFKDDKDGKKGPPASPSLRVARKVYYSYREKLLTNNAVDFDDLILMTRELLIQNEELRERLHKRWPHVLVDEFQDTSKTQLDLVKLLTSSSLFVVGDADQAIYSWRGAHVGSLDDVKTEFEPYGRVHTVHLKENYRSTSNIVRAAEKVISSKHREAADTVAADDARQSMKPTRGAGPSPRVVACEDERGEANFVVETILNMTAKGDVTPSNTVSVLYRTNAQSRYLEEACVAKNLPYVIRGGAGGFYKRAEIKDILCFLQCLHNGNDEGSMLRAIKTPSKGIGDKAIAEFRDYCETIRSYYREFYPLSKRPTILDILISLTDGLADSDDTDAILPFGAPQAADHISKRALNNFVGFSSKMRDIRAKAKVKTVDELIYYITEEFKLMDHFDSISKSTSEFNERQENVKELRQAAKKYAAFGTALKDGVQADSELGGAFDAESALSTFLDDVALVSDIAEADDKGEGSPGRLVVNLMTIHASKGTEFDAVFVVGLEEGTLPCNPAIQQGQGSVQLEEEKRLCYVAMTRAKTHLILSWRREVTSFSNWSDSGPNTTTKQRSRFLDAIVAKKSKDKASKQGIVKPPVNSLEKQQSRRSFSTARHGLKGAEGRKSRPLGSVPAQLYKTNKEAMTTEAQKARRLNDLHDAHIHDSRTLSKPSKSKKDAGAKHSTVPALDINIADMKASLSSRPLKPVTVDRKKATKTINPIVSQPLVDPAWFFPVGEKVVHRNFGKGVVLGHPPFSNIEDSAVIVQFENGRTMEFPALGSDILPDF